MYREDRIAPDRARAISARLLAADHHLLAAAGDIFALRREVERAVASRKRHGPGYPSGERLVSALTEAQRQIYAAHEERIAIDELLDRPAPTACTMVPDPPRLGARPEPDERSRRWWPAPFDPIGMLVWYLHYRPWWSTLDLTERRIRDDRLALREREQSLRLRTEPGLQLETLPAIDSVIG